MKLVNAKVAGQPRIAVTKFGERSVMDCRTEDGQTVTIWRPVGDLEVMGRANGERVTIALDSKGKASLVETARTRAEETTRPPGLDVETANQQMAISRSEEIADYIDRLGKLYAHTYKSIATKLAETPLATPEIKDVATTLFIQTVRHFNL
jgi:hypothetical protein